MPVPVPAWAADGFPDAKSLNIALYSSDGTGDNPAGIAFHAYRPVLFETYSRTATFASSPAGTQSTMSGSGTISSGLVVYDTAGLSGQTSDLPGTGYYQYTAVINGSAGDGVTPGGWVVLAHFVPLHTTSTQTSVSAGFQQAGGGTTAGTRQAPNSVNPSCPFFCDLANVGTVAWRPVVTVGDSSSVSVTNVLNAADSSGQTPRMYAIWAGVSASSSGQAVYTAAGVYNFTAPAGVFSVTPAATGSAAGAGAGNASAGGIEYGGGGGSGGEFATGSVAVTPLNNYPVTVGAAGTGGTAPGGNGGAGASSSFSGDSASITAHGGNAGLGATTSGNGTGGAAASGSTAPTHFNSGAGANGKTATYGGGGGSSAGTGSAGNAGSGAKGGSAPAGGGPGGTGGTSAITIVQSVSGKATKSTLTIKFASPLQAGNGLILTVTHISTNAGAVSSVVLSDSAHLNQEANQQINSLVPSQLYVFDIFGVAGAETSVTITGDSGSDQVLLAEAWEVAGMGSSPTVDANAGTSSPPSASTSSYSVSAATSDAPELWIGTTAGKSNTSFSVNSPSGSWTTSAIYGSNGGQTGGIRSGYQIVTSAGTLKYAGKFSHNVNWAALGVSYAPAAATPGSAPVIGPGGGGGGGLGPGGNGGPGYDGQVILTWTGQSGSGYGTPPLPAPFTGYSPATAIGTSSAADVNINGPDGITDVVNFLSSPPLLRVAGTAAQSIPSGSTAPTAVTFSGATVSVDNYACWSSGTCTIQRDGLYLAHGLVCFANAAGGTRQAGVAVNGVTYWGPPATPASAGATHVPKTQIFSLRAGDTVTLTCRQDSGSAVALSTTSATRLMLVWLGLPGDPAQPWTPPDTTFRWASGTAGENLGGGLAALMQTHLASDLGFLCNRPFLMAYQTIAQSGLSVGSFSTVTLDTVGGIVHGDTGDNYTGWSAGPSNAYVAPVSGWYLMAGEFFTTSSAAAGATVTAGVAASSSGGVTPSQATDWYQSLTATSTAGGGATVLGMQYLLAGESVMPQVQAVSFSGAYGTLTGASNGGTYAAHFSCIWLSE